ncbi:Alpha/Beta hydrolase protein [Pseudomassariella vexata]|uniref:Alpha/Beta hydrolase protein n=1 Tax=Pseudomassariella vexata TaxID=1141098 RepID=A0A1Y2DGS4_9PEZI|nr:Alpha/Beta hydrolase protein [Pseudomassariella vexata]ORY58470.1 Alpha/Beta hydrolase protein [Pseudomassariella vexata]
MESDIQFVEINGARLAYRIRGPENAPLIISLHGGRGMGDHRSDFKAYSPLSNAGAYRLLSFDYRGHGQSSKTKPYTFDQIVDDVEGMRVHFAGNGAKVVICGGSFGGFLALRYAIKYPQGLGWLLLRGTAASCHQEEDAIKVLEQRIAKAPSFSVEMLKNKVFGRFESDLEFRLVHLAMSPLYSENFDANKALEACLGNVYNAEAHNDLYSETEKYFDYRDQLHLITAKTLVVVGQEDWICPPENSKYIADRIPGARLLIVDGANHSVHLEKNELVLREIRQHLET